MRYHQTLRALALFGACSMLAPSLRAQTVGPDYPIPPSIEYGDLYSAVELAGIFPDSKTFPDLVPTASPSDIVAAYDAAKGSPGFDLASFVSQYFSSAPVPPGPTINPASSDQHLLDYVASLWPELEQTSTSVPPYSTLLPLPYPYVVPGGRFREVYYWDSYFTMLGLEVDGRDDLATDMLKDFAYEIDKYGHIPNGNRSYYLSRSQPPFFSLMIDLIAQYRRHRDLHHLPAGAAGRIRLLDAGRERSPARPRRAQRGAAAERHGAQPLLGRARSTPRRILR